MTRTEFKQALKAAKLINSRRNTLTQLLDLADDNLTFVASKHDLSRLMGVKPSSALGRIDRLKKKGWIKRIIRRTPNGASLTSIYQLTTPDTAATKPPPLSPEERAYLQTIIDLTRKHQCPPMHRHVCPHHLDKSGEAILAGLIKQGWVKQPYKYGPVVPCKTPESKPLQLTLLGSEP